MGTLTDRAGRARQAAQRLLARPNPVPPAAVRKAGAILFRAKKRVADLSPLERLLVALHHQEPDRVPVVPGFLGAARRLTGLDYPTFARDPVRAAEAFLAAARIVGGDGIAVALDLSVEAADFGQEIIYPPDTTAHPNPENLRIREPADYARLEPFDPRTSPRMGAYIRTCREVVDRIRRPHRLMTNRLPVAAGLLEPLAVLAMMRGAERLYTDCIENREAVRTGLEVVTEVLVREARALCETGVLLLGIDTLLASHSGVSRDLWRELEFDPVARIAREIRRNGSLVGLHNCGHGPYFDLQIEAAQPAAISFLHPPDDCECLADAKRKYGRRVTLCGCLDPTAELLWGTPQEVVDACRGQMEVLGAGGGFMLAPGCEYPPSIPLDNAIAVVRAAELYGRYPLGSGPRYV